jgi:MoaA/NifB/PqqE/SkfB family radical SAM enzyme
MERPLVKNGKQLFVFWQFNGDNSCYCNLKCPECYGRTIRTGAHYWNGQVAKWEKAFLSLNRDIYFVFSYGEALLSHGFYDCVDLIGAHDDNPRWTLNIISNLMTNPERLLRTRLVADKRLFMIPCWHPEGVDNPVRDWEVFKRHLLMLKDAGVPTHVMMVWFPPVIKHFAEYFEWLDKNDFRVGIRRFVVPSNWSKIPKIRSQKWFLNQYHLSKYTPAESGYLRSYTCPKVTKYGLDNVSPRGKLCYAGQDMILVRSDGTVKPCASTDFPGNKCSIGNIFSPNFKLKAGPISCPTNNCGGDFGMLVLPDAEFEPLPQRLWDDTFLSQIENVRQSSPVAYPKRAEMLRWLEKIKCQR